MLTYTNGITDVPTTGVTTPGGLTRSGTPWYFQSTALNGVNPTLVYDFERNRYYDSSVGIRPFPFSAVRTSNATMFNSLGQLVWAPANMCINSTPGATGWIVSGAGASCNTTGGVTPRGGPEAKLIAGAGLVLDANDGVGSANLAVNITVATGSTLVYSFDARAGEFTSIRIRETISTGARMVVDLTNGNVTPEFGSNNRTTGVEVTASDLGGGWYRIIARRTASTTTFDLDLKPGAAVGDGTSGIFIGSVQIELDGVDAPKPFVLTSGTAYYGPRLDYNSATLESRGLLSEQASTNLLLGSTNPTTGQWLLTDATATPNAIGIEGAANTAYTILEGTAGTATVRMSQTGGATVTAGATVCGSVVIKYVNCQWVRLRLFESAFADGVNCWFDIQNGVVGSNSVSGTGVFVSATIVPLRDGYYRLIFTATPNASYTSLAFQILSASADASATRVNNASYLLQHPQVEILSTATSIIPTYAATATRASDVFTTTSVGWLNQAELTAYMKFIPGTETVIARRFFAISDGTTSNLRGALRSTSRISQNWSVIGGVSTFSPNTSNTSTNLVVSKAAHLFGSAPIQAVCLNGGTVATSVVATPTSGYTTLDVGKTVASSTNLNGWIQEFRVYPDASASGAQLQALTT